MSDMRIFKYKRIYDAAKDMLLSKDVHRTVGFGREYGIIYDGYLVAACRRLGTTIDELFYFMLGIKKYDMSFEEMYQTVGFVGYTLNNFLVNNPTYSHEIHLSLVRWLDDLRWSDYIDDLLLIRRV